MVNDVNFLIEWVRSFYPHGQNPPLVHGQMTADQHSPSIANEKILTTQSQTHNPSFVPKETLKKPLRTSLKFKKNITQAEKKYEEIVFINLHIFKRNSET